MVTWLVPWLKTSDMLRSISKPLATVTFPLMIVGTLFPDQSVQLGTEVRGVPLE